MGLMKDAAMACNGLGVAAAFGGAIGFLWRDGISLAVQAMMSSWLPVGGIMVFNGWGRLIQGLSRSCNAC